MLDCSPSSNLCRLPSSPGHPQWRKASAGGRRSTHPGCPRTHTHTRVPASNTKNTSSLSGIVAAALRCSSEQFSLFQDQLMTTEERLVCSLTSVCPFQAGLVPGASASAKRSSPRGGQKALPPGSSRSYLCLNPPHTLRWKAGPGWLQLPFVHYVHHPLKTSQRPCFPFCKKLSWGSCANVEAATPGLWYLLQRASLSPIFKEWSQFFLGLILHSPPPLFSPTRTHPPFITPGTVAGHCLSEIST